MDILDIILLTLSLSIDNFAVSVASSCCGVKTGVKQILKVALSFSFTGLIFLSAGYYGGGKLLKFISSWDHIIGPLILFYLGAKMIKAAFPGKEEKSVCHRFDMNGLKVLLALAVATNIDVLAAGVSMAALEVKIFAVAVFLFLFVSSAVVLGFALGSKMGARFGDTMEAVGGAVLILLSLKIFLEG